MKNQPHIALEITSKSVRIAVGNEVNGKIYILDLIEKDCNGIQNGFIVDSGIVVNTIKSVLNQIQNNLSLKISEVTLVVPPFNLSCMIDSQSFVTASSDGLIENNDIRNIITMMKKKVLGDADLKIIDAVPDKYIINGNEVFSYAPLGKRSEQITISAFLYAISEKMLRQYTTCVENAGLVVKYLVVAPYAESLYLSTLDNIPTNYILLDVGHSITTVSYVINNKSILSSRMINFGGHNITKHIMETLNITYQDAEMLKCKYGIDNDPLIPIKIKDDITFDDLSKAIMSSFDDYFDKISKIVKLFNIPNSLNVPMVVTGGGAHLTKFNSVLSEELNIDIIEYSSNTLGAREKSNITLLGAIKYSAIQPTVDQEEQVISTITRVGNRINLKKDDLDDEL